MIPGLMPATAVPVRALPPWLRAAAASLQAFAALNLVELALRAALDMFAPLEVERVPLPYLVQRLFFASAIPALLAAALQRTSTLRLEGDRAVLSLGAEIPFAAVAALRPFSIPLPQPGFSLRLRSGRNFAYGICARDPGPLAAALCAAAGLPPPDDATFRDATVRAHTRRLHHPALKFGLVPALVTFILFRLHQRISFGDLFGEYTAYGLARWLHTLAGVALFVFGHFALLAGGLRALAELFLQPVLRLAPRLGSAARWTVEIALAAAYYGGTAAALLLRLG